jgi:probable F420-dependent oxidoreductase
VKFGIFGLHRGSSADPEVLTRRAVRAEELGFESLWVGDHIALPASGDDSGDNMPQQSRLEALIALTFMAAVTTRMRLGVGVIVLPQRQPVLLAKQLACLDVLSGGRLIVGLGVGYVEAELRALGASLADRGARTDEYLAAMRALWSAEPASASYSGRFVEFHNVVQRPLPVQQPHPPIIFGGQSPAALRRTVLTGDGWHGFDLDLDATAKAIVDLQDASVHHGRDPERHSLEISITPPAGALSLETAQRYADLGVDRLVVEPHRMDGTEIDDLMSQLADTLIGRI